MMLLLALCCMTLTAGAQRVLTLDECHQLALKNNKKLKVSEEEVNKARYEMYSSYANYLPKVSATATYTHNNKSVQLLSDENIAALNNIGTMTQAQIDAGYYDITSKLVYPEGSSTGTYSFTLTLAEDTNQLPDDVTPSGETSKTVTVTITYDKTSGELRATSSPANSTFKFTNIYNAEAAVEITAKKDLIGRKLNAEDFTFTLLHFYHLTVF